MQYLGHPPNWLSGDHVLNVAAYNKLDRDREEQQKDTRPEHQPSCLSGDHVLCLSLRRQLKKKNSASNTDNSARGFELKRQ